LIVWSRIPRVADAASSDTKSFAKLGAIDQLMLLGCFLAAHATAPTALRLNLEAIFS
jgi:hypothetical protein